MDAWLTNFLWFNVTLPPVLNFTHCSNSREIRKIDFEEVQLHR